MMYLEAYADRMVFVLCAALIFVPLEQLLPLRRREHLLRADLRLDLAYMVLGVIATMLAAALFVAVVVAIIGPLVPESARSVVSGLPIWAQVLGLIILGDLYYYWAHRIFHMVPAIWPVHAVHHSIEHMDWIAAHRAHPIDTAITNSGYTILAILFDVSGVAFAIFSLQFSVHSLLKHSNVRIDWGVLGWLYVTPRFHHWHHANVPAAYDRNFAAQFPLWDVLFGTALARSGESPPRYGVDDPVPRSFLGSLAYPVLPRKDAPVTPAIAESALTGHD